MNLMGTKHHMGAYVEHFVLTPPRGEAPHAKSPEAVAEAYGIYEQLVLSELSAGGGVHAHDDELR